MYYYKKKDVVLKGFDKYWIRPDMFYWPIREEYYHLRPAWRSVPQTLVNCFQRSGKKLKTLKLFISLSLTLHLMGQWGQHWGGGGWGWGYLSYLYFYHVRVYFDRKMTTLERKAGTRRRRYLWRYKYLLKVARLPLVGRWFNYLQFYLYGLSIHERVTGAFGLMGLMLNHNILKTRSVKLTRRAIEIKGLFRRGFRRFKVLSWVLLYYKYLFVSSDFDRKLNFYKYLSFWWLTCYRWRIFKRLITIVRWRRWRRRRLQHRVRRRYFKH